MKTTKRILVLITAFILCLAPLVIGVASAEMNDVCPHYKTAVIDRGPISRSYRVAEANKCYCYEYDNASYTCDDCGHVWEGTYIVYTQHHMVSNGVCAYCGYDSNND